MLRGATSLEPRQVAVPKPVIATGFPCATRVRTPSWYRSATSAETLVHDAQLDAGDEHDLGSRLPEPLRPLRAVGEQRQDLRGRQVDRIRREPDLEPEFGGAAGRQFQSLRIATDDLHGIAVQVVSDD